MESEMLNTRGVRINTVKSMLLYQICIYSINYFKYQSKTVPSLSFIGSCCDLPKVSRINKSDNRMAMQYRIGNTINPPKCSGFRDCIGKPWLEVKIKYPIIRGISALKSVIAALFNPRLAARMRAEVFSAIRANTSA